MSKNRYRQDRKGWFCFVKSIVKIRYRRPHFVYLDEKPSAGSLIISNHEGTDAPLSLELYADYPVRFWGAHEMNGSLKSLYAYQTKVYYHEKKHWNLFLARLFCLIASPLTHMFYRGLKVISTYRDNRFLKTVRESTAVVNNGENIVIFPEVSDKGYLPELEGFYNGFLLFAEACYKKGTDVPIYLAYFRKKDCVYIFDAPVLYSTLKTDFATREDAAHHLLCRINELGKMSV